MIALSFAAAASSRIGIATGVLLLPEHNPLVVAKEAASLDRLSGGRLTLGVGVGWSREEFDALGVPFERRAARTAEYVAAMRTLWRDDVASFHGDFVGFDEIRVNPKPVRDRRIPIVLGGNSDAALRRVVAWGDGWYAFNLDGVTAVRSPSWASTSWFSWSHRRSALTPPRLGFPRWPTGGWGRCHRGARYAGSSI